MYQKQQCMNKMFSHYDLLKYPSSVRPYDIFRVTGCCLWKSILWGWPLPPISASRIWSERNRQYWGAVISASSPTVLQQRVHVSLCAYVRLGWSQTVNIALSFFNSTSRRSVSDGGKMLHSLTFLVKTQNRREEREGRGEEEENEECGWRGGGLIISVTLKIGDSGKKKIKKTSCSAKNHSSIEAIWKMCAPWGGAWEAVHITCHWVCISECVCVNLKWITEVLSCIYTEREADKEWPSLAWIALIEFSLSWFGLVKSSQDSTSAKSTPALYWLTTRPSGIVGLRQTAK